MGIVAGKIALEKLGALSTAITNRAIDINRVTYCLTEETISLDDWLVRRAFLSPARIELLREADDLVMKFIEKEGVSLKVWQFPVVLIPLGKKQGKGESVVLRPVTSVDGMTAEFSTLTKDALQQLSTRLMNLGGIDAVLLDITNKPPGTIEWE